MDDNVFETPQKYLLGRDTIVETSYYLSYALEYIYFYNKERLDKEFHLINREDIEQIFGDEEPMIIPLHGDEYYEQLNTRLIQYFNNNRLKVVPHHLGFDVFSKIPVGDALELFEQCHEELTEEQRVDEYVERALQLQQEIEQDKEDLQQELMNEEERDR